MVRDWLMHLIGADRKSKKRRDVLIHESGATSAGCMCAVFHLFENVHQFQFPLNNQQQQRPSSAFLDHQEDEITPSKGVEAPRNSLEVVDQPKKPSMNASDSNSVAVREEKDNIKSHIPVGIQNIKTKHVKVSSPRTSTKSRLTDGYSSSSDQCNNSPGLTKTPTLVARLMGLDLLPEECCSSPSLSSASSSKPYKRDHFQKIKRTALTSFSEDDIRVGARSLPETPRISSARRSDVEYYHHRLSLQVNRDQNVRTEEKQLKGGRCRILSNQDHGKNVISNSSSSPRHYARQIVNNVRESVSRRVGLTDITNTDRESRRDQNLVLLEPTRKKSTRFNQDLGRIRGEDKENQSRLRLVETTKNKTSTSSGVKSSPRLSSSSSRINDVILNPLKSNKLEITESVAKAVDRGSCAKSCSSSLITGKFRASECATKNKREEQFVRSNTTCKVRFCNDHHSKFKKTPLLSEVLSMKQIKKDPSPSPTKLPQKQVSYSRDALPSRRSTRLSSKPSHSYEHSNKILSSGLPENVPPRDLHRSFPSSTALHGGDVAAECGKYIQLILNRAGITERANRWHSLKQPADPFIFYHLELFHYGGGDGGGGGMLSLRCNRKLIFQLVNELLADIMIHDKICHLGLRHDDEDKVPLLDELCQKINSFPEASCEVLEDIDYLIGTDTSKWESNSYYDMELESIMCEVEGEMVEHLVKETVVMILEEQRLRQKQRVLRISSAFM